MVTNDASAGLVGDLGRLEDEVFTGDTTGLGGGGAGALVGETDRNVFTGLLDL